MSTYYLLLPFHHTARKNPESSVFSTDLILAWGLWEQETSLDLTPRAVHFALLWAGRRGEREYVAGITSPRKTASTWCRSSIVFTSVRPTYGLGCAVCGFMWLLSLW